VPSLCHSEMVLAGTFSNAATSSVVNGGSDSALPASDSGMSIGALSVGGQSGFGQDHSTGIG
jgi:hypothetical protein